MQGPGGSPKYTWSYDENHARIKETRVVAGATRTTWNLHPDNQGGLGFECESAGASVNCNSTTTQRRHFLSAGGMSIGVLVSNGALPTLAATDSAPPVVTTTLALVKLEYWHKDHLGSLVASTDHAGAVTARYAYDPFGKRRQANGNYDAFGALVFDWTTNTNRGTDRGYTGHEHLDDVGLVHMNGRIFDPTLGRFMQADPFVQDPTQLQNFDRYGYCFNNPLTCTDPSGLSFWTSFRDAAIRVAAAVADGYGCAGWCSAAVGAYQGRRTGGDRGAIIGAVNGYFGYQLQAGGYSEAAVVGFSAASGCAGAWASGGKCGQGAVSGVIQHYGGKYGIEGQVAAGCVSAAATGGNCREGARGAFASSLGSSVASWVAQESRAYVVYLQTEPSAVIATNGFTYDQIRERWESCGCFDLAAALQKSLDSVAAAVAERIRMIDRLSSALATIILNEGANGEKPSLLDPQGETHVLDGDAEGGGHAPGTGSQERASSRRAGRETGFLEKSRMWQRTLPRPGSLGAMEEPLLKVQGTVSGSE